MEDSNKEKIYIFDTTLRDGQQSPGAGLTFEDNIIYADYADKINIDVLEAGFPAASQTDFNIVKSISDRMTKRQSQMVISGLCQLREAQATITMKSLESSNKIGQARIHTYFPVDPNLIQASLGGKSLDQKDTINNLYNIINIATKEGFEV
ncbi:MAG: 2-isopropylmalate synthase, partial [Francisellaceae bacterium]